MIVLEMLYGCEAWDWVADTYEWGMVRCLYPDCTVCTEACLPSLSYILRL